MTQKQTIPAEWTEALDRIQNQLEQILARLGDPPPPGDPRDSGESQSCEIRERLRRRLEQLDARVAQSKEQGEIVETALAKEAVALQAWLKASAQVKDQWARMTSRAIS